MGQAVNALLAAIAAAGFVHLVMSHYRATADQRRTRRALVRLLGSVPGENHIEPRQRFPRLVKSKTVSKILARP
jgi:hypothetical protein